MPARRTVHPDVVGGAPAVSARSGYQWKGCAEVIWAALDRSGVLRPETGRAPRLELEDAPHDE